MKECINLTNSVRVGTSGNLTPCCLAIGTPYQDDKGNIMNVSTHTFEDIMMSPTAIDLRERTKRGETPDACSICWKEEDIGHESKRLRDNNHFKEVEHKENELIYLELNLGNICNLACRSCNVAASSNWKKYHNIGNPDNRKTPEELDLIAKLHSNPFNDESMVWNSLKENLHTVKLLELYGGEPMLMKKQWEILKYSVDKGYSKNQIVHFNTNGTLFKKEHIELLKHFWKCDISFSLDGIKEKFEYLRYPGKWEDVEINIENWLKHTSPFPNFHFNICLSLIHI